MHFISLIKTEITQLVEILLHQATDPNSPQFGTTAATMSAVMALAYRQTSHISRTLVGDKIMDHSDAVGALLQLHLHSRLNTWFQRIG